MNIRVLVIDRSALVRNLFARMLELENDIEVVGVTGELLLVRNRIEKLRPDVLVLDGELLIDHGEPVDRRVELLGLPTVILASGAGLPPESVLGAVGPGAVYVLDRPSEGPVRLVERLVPRLVESIRSAAGEEVGACLVRVDEKHSVDVVVPRAGGAPAGGGPAPLIAIGASLGGTEAIKEILSALPSGLPPIVITQHIPPGFSATFAKRMNRITPLQVYEAEDGQPVLPGHVYVAPGDRHLLVDCEGAGYQCRLNDGPQVNRHKPSVDVLFRSVVHCAGDSAIGVLLTGMGDDGARCLLEMREAGARTLAQDEASSVVWGMPGMAVKLGAAERVLPLREIPSALVALVPNVSRRAAGRSRLAAGRFFP